MNELRKNLNGLKLAVWILTEAHKKTPDTIKEVVNLQPELPKYDAVEAVGICAQCVHIRLANQVKIESQYEFAKCARSGSYISVETKDCFDGCKQNRRFFERRPRNPMPLEILNDLENNPQAVEFLLENYEAGQWR